MNDDRYVTGIDFASPLGDRQDERGADRYDATQWMLDGLRRQEADRIYRAIVDGMRAGVAEVEQGVYQHVWTASGAYRDRAAEQAVGYDPPGYPEAPPICRCELDDPVISPDAIEAEFRVVESRRLDS